MFNEAYTCVSYYQHMLTNRKWVKLHQASWAIYKTSYLINRIQD